MRSIRDYIDPGGRMLARRLDQLCSTLEGLGTRLSGTIANVIGETIGGFVRDTTLRIVDDLMHCLPEPEVGHRQPSMQRHESYDRYRDEYDQRGYWDDDREFDEPDIEDQPAPIATERLPTAVSAGLTAASWWLRRWTGNRRTLTTLAVGFLAGSFVYLGGPLAAAVLYFAGTATQFTSLSDAINAGTAAMNYHKPD